MKIKFDFIKFLLGIIFISISLFIIYLVINCCKKDSLLENMTNKKNILNCIDTYPQLRVKKISNNDDNNKIEHICPDNFIMLDDFKNCDESNHMVHSIYKDKEITVNGTKYKFLGFSHLRGCWPKEYNTSELLDPAYGINNSHYRQQAYVGLNFNDELFSKKPKKHDKHHDNHHDSHHNKHHSSHNNSHNNIIPDSGSGSINNNMIPDAGSGPINNEGMNNIYNNQNIINPIKKSEIPEGDEDLYILKSEIVPPVCPQCPNIEIDENMLKNKCPPCPPCARCPEPNFECQKVPNYSLGNQNKYLPMPILTDFSTFGT